MAPHLPKVNFKQKTYLDTRKTESHPNKVSSQSAQGCGETHTREDASLLRHVPDQVKVTRFFRLGDPVDIHPFVSYLFQDHKIELTLRDVLLVNDVEKSIYHTYPLGCRLEPESLGEVRLAEYTMLNNLQRCRPGSCLNSNIKLNKFIWIKLWQVKGQIKTRIYKPTTAESPDGPTLLSLGSLAKNQRLDLRLSCQGLWRKPPGEHFFYQWKLLDVIIRNRD